ncbi:DUF6838 family protein [Sporosarcina sp. P17b]|uniref:phage tail terminator family protein n=1 Tax=Sporosarcina sp. P17b TaxID=2048260 RepID=UPI000C16BCD4|nr:hypothetical protein [Sporosarcina sp. P17b]PIC72429.1 hypothetical protein CSV76_15405 [Sporosarcina sp. P17b]
MSISIVDIKRSILNLLKKKYPNHTRYAEKMPTDFKRPSFYLYFVPLESAHSTRLFIEKSLMVKLDCYSLSRTNEENLIMADALESIFHNTLKVGNRFFSIIRTKSDFMEDVLTFTFTLNFDDGVNVLFAGDDFTEDDEELGYTEGKIRFMEKLELK